MNETIRMPIALIIWLLLCISLLVTVYPIMNNFMRYTRTDNAKRFIVFRNVLLIQILMGLTYFIVPPEEIARASTWNCIRAFWVLSIVYFGFFLVSGLLLDWLRRNEKEQLIEPQKSYKDEMKLDV